MPAISSYRGNRPTNKHRQDRLQYTAPQLARSVKILPANYTEIMDMQISIFLAVQLLLLEMKWNERLWLKWRYHRWTVAGALYNLGSGSWLALTVVPWRKLVAAHSPR